jgi:MATE family multidrug resistance protein
MHDTVRPFAVTHGAVFHLAVPAALTYLSTPLVGAVGTAVVGQLGSAPLIGGVAVAAVIFDVLFATFNFLRGATTGLTAQALGAGDRLEQQSVLFRALAVALAAAAVMLVAQHGLASLGIWAMGVDGEVAEVALAYFSVRIWSAPFALMNYALLGWVVGRGAAMLGLLLQTVLNGLNIALAILFVLDWGWGVEGVALASVLAEAVAAALGLAVAAWTTSGATRPAWRAIFDLARLRRMMAINTDMMVRSFSLLFAYAFFLRESADFGAVILAGNTVLMHFFAVAGNFLDGFATAAEQLAGRAVGARYRAAFDRAVRLTTGWGLVTALAVSCVFALLGPAIIDLMTTAPEVREAARRYLAWAAITPLAGIVAFQMDGIFIGATWSRDMRNMMLLSVMIYLVAWAGFTPLFGTDGLWAALIVFLSVRSIAFHWRMQRLLPRTFPAQP